ncbi:hypothetical protein KI387_028571 [Taxus chinensis]|uniref:Uncharacterized protein n=1 Tax=Taxus chinensis TaxID=29808 RepID=A0AA38F8X0_TAXCH|nr:hypothetical protein KI387_028571 [Taxus chinensis]
MLHDSAAPLSVRGQSQADQVFRQLCSLFYCILESPVMESGSLGHGRVGRGRMTPAGFASLLFGIASALMLIGSTAFMIGIMMMPLVAMLAMVFSFIGIFVNVASPAMWSWSRNGGLDKKNRKDDCRHFQDGTANSPARILFVPSDIDECCGSSELDLNPWFPTAERPVHSKWPVA